MTHKTAIISYEHRVYLFWTLVLVSVIALGLYIYSVNSIIRNTAMRQELETRVSHLSAEIASLEFDYIEKRNAISMEVAYEHGFKEVRSPLYVSRVPGSALTYNTSR